jgi:rhodanese-related sulfurtransferase
MAKTHSREFEALVDEARPRVAEVEIDDFLKMPPEVLLVDVREDDEWRAGHIAGAKHIGKGVIERDIVERVPDKERELVLYCGGGYRSVLAADALTKMGYRRVKSLIGGWRAWTNRGLPTVVDDVATTK